MAQDTPGDGAGGFTPLAVLLHEIQAGDGSTLGSGLAEDGPGPLLGPGDGEADRERARAGPGEVPQRGGGAEAYLWELGFPIENRAPVWEQVPVGMGGLHGYCLDLASHYRERHGLFLGSGVGAGKTCALAMIAIAARREKLSCEYILAGWQLLERLAETKEWPFPAVQVLLLDDLDYITTAGFDAVRRSWDTIGQFLYQRAAYGGITCVVGNDTYQALTGHPGMERAASRWERMIPPELRFTTAGPDQRLPAPRPTLAGRRPANAGEETASDG